MISRAEFKFNQYTADELRLCGEAFRDAFDDEVRLGHKAEWWTPKVLNWFKETAGDGLSVFHKQPDPDGHPNQRCEIMQIDQCHTTYPRWRAEEKWPSKERWSRILSGPCEWRLALESQWGGSENASRCYVRMMDDAAKLAAVRSNVKVIIVHSHRSEDCCQDRLVHSFNRLRLQSRDESPWLWIDVPWDARVHRDIQWNVLDG